MKIRFIYFSLFLLIVFMEACSSGPVMTQATGFAYEVVVVMDNEIWNKSAGQAIKSEIQSSVPGLPQSEPSMKITYVKPEDFSGLLRYVRNILIVKIDPAIYTKVAFSHEENVWARGQVVVTLTAPSEEAILEYANKKSYALVDFFVKVEMNRAIEQLKNEYSMVVMEKLREKFNISLNVPSTFVYYKDTTDFFWSSNNANTGRMDLVVYSFPYTDQNTFTSNYLIAKRDSVLKQHLPGSFPGSYVQTETRAGIDYRAITYNGRYCGVMRGLWRVQGDMMGGPFVSHTCLDEKNNRVIVIEGFVYAPETDKRNFIRRIEAALFTLQLQSDVENSADKESIE